METTHLGLVLMLCLGVHGSSSEILLRQKRNWIIDSFQIDEGYDGPFPYSLGVITVEKNLTFFKISGQGVDEEPKETLQIHEITGEVTVHRPVDFEMYRFLKLKFQAIDRENKVIDTQLGIEIGIIDSNDNAPKFDREMYEITVEESTAQGTALVTLSATDKDTKNNGIFTMKIVSVTPKPEELEFVITQVPHMQTGTISFKGCLDHERAAKYTIIVEAKDHGAKKQLFSSCTVIINIEDGNNHAPIITGQTGTGRVKEGEENVVIRRVHVTDKDSKGTAAWRARYQIHGDTNNNFRITTDPETNDGLLYVEKHLDHEATPLRKLTISVENEIPYRECKVVRKTTGLWEIEIIGAGTGMAIGAGTGMAIGAGTGMAAGAESTVERTDQSIVHTTVTVEDVNEAPVFDKTHQKVTLSENMGAGQYLVTFTAQDPDVKSSSRIEYSKGHDPAGWVTVDPTTGKITTSNSIDRESPFVEENIYRVTIFAIDNGIPPATSTATLSIHIMDENDNAPTLNTSTIDMCQTHGPSLAEITASDLDEDPYGGPFTFKLLGDVEGKWRVDPSQGYSINLVKESRVHSGHFKLLLEVSSLQQETVVHNLSVTVCNCLNPERPNCRSRKASGSSVGAGAFGIIFCSILVFAGVLLLALGMECNSSATHSEIPEEGSQHLMICNSEKLGNDCKVASVQVKQEPFPVADTRIKREVIVSGVKVSHDDHRRGTAMDHEFRRGNSMRWSTDRSSNIGLKGFHQDNASLGMLTSNSVVGSSQDQGLRKSFREFKRENSIRWSTGATSANATTHRDSNFMHWSYMKGGKYSAGCNMYEIQREFQFRELHKKLYALQHPDEELGDYAPHVYAEEEDREDISYELDAITIPDISFDSDLDLDLDFRFNTLASICMPSQNTAYGTKTMFFMEKHETATVKSKTLNQTTTTVKYVS